MTLENSNRDKEEVPNEHHDKHLDGQPLSVSEIIATGDLGAIAELDKKYTVETLASNEKNDLSIVENENWSDNFPESTIVKKGETYFAVRKNKDGEWVGNSFTLMSDGNIGAIYRAHNLDKSIIEIAENKLALTIPILSRDLMDMGLNEEKRLKFLNELKNLPPEKTINIYHGVNGGIGGTLGVLDSSGQGVKQISGPCFSAYPLGQFWKPGDAGFKYSIPRSDIEFPDENKSEAHFRMDNEGIVFLINGLDTLSLTEFDGEVMRTIRTEEVYEKDEDGFNKAKAVNGEWVDLPPVEKVVPLTNEEKVIEKKIQEKLKELSNIRKANNH